jgi:hypothetical protein
MLRTKSRASHMLRKSSTTKLSSSVLQGKFSDATLVLSHYEVKSPKLRETLKYIVSTSTIATNFSKEENRIFNYRRIF